MADTSPRRVCVIGLGYVGLPTAASIAAQGVEVIGVDVDAERLSAIGVRAPRQRRKEDLNELVRKVVAAGTAVGPRRPRSRPTPSSSRCRRRTDRITPRT